MGGQHCFYAFGTGFCPFVRAQMSVLTSVGRTHVNPFPLFGALDAYVGTKAVENGTPFIYPSNQTGNRYGAEYRTGIPKSIAARTFWFGGKSY
jgi:hypothetical protein